MEIKTESTSLVTAQVSDLLLREGANSRLIFRPSIINNENQSEASVRGIFLYQKKKRNSGWEDFETIPLSSVKIGEGYKLELKSAEMLSVYEHVGKLYDLHASAGVPRGKKSFVQVTPQLEALAAIENTELNKLLNSNAKLGNDLLAKLLNWACDAEDPLQLIGKLSELSSESLSTLNAAVGLNRLKKAIKLWEDNAGNSDEEFWQKTLTCLLYTSPSPRDGLLSRMPSSA